MLGIEKTIRRVRESVPSHCHWAVADQSLLASLCRGEPVKRGTRGTALKRLLGFLHLFRLALVTAGLVGCVEIARAVFKQIRCRIRAHAGAGEQASARKSATVFVGFGARAEHALLKSYQSQANGRIIFVDQCNLVESGAIGHPTIGQIMCCFASAIRELCVAVRSLPADLRERYIDFMTFAAMRLGTYSYARAWWRKICAEHEIREATFLAADTNSFAAIREGVKCSLLQHGLLHKGLLLPGFDEVCALTYYEQGYIQRTLPRATVRVGRELSPNSMELRQRSLLIASGNRPVEEMRLVAPLIRELSQLGFSVHVRPFKGEDLERFWKPFQIEHDIFIESATGSFDQLLEDLRPTFVASWGSTALADALYRGIIPICVAAAGDRHVEETVYPLFRCCLRWPSQRDKIRQAINCQKSYREMFKRLRSHDLGAIERVA